jgi:RNA polymerase sigma-70 factor (ECF subfamily)
MTSMAAPEPATSATFDASQLSALMARIAAGDHAALAKLYDSTSRTVYGLALRIVAEPASAEEIALDVYLQVWRTAASYSSARGSVNAWLVTLTRSRAVDWTRSRQGRFQRRRQDLEALPEQIELAPSPEANQQTEERAVVVRKALRSLPKDQQTIVELGFFSELSHMEIAESLKLPLGTVKSRMRAGLKQLRIQLQASREVAL